MSDKKKYKRSHYIVEKNMQYRYVELILMHMLIFFLVTVVIIYFSGWRQLVQKLSNVYPQAMLVNILNAVYIKLWMGFIILLPVACISAILASHKIAGPLVRIRRALNQLAGNDYNLFVKLRKGDDLQDVADQINKLAESLRKKKNV